MTNKNKKNKFSKQNHIYFTFIYCNIFRLMKDSKTFLKGLETSPSLFLSLSFEMAQRLEAEGNKNFKGKSKWDDGSDKDDIGKISVRCEDGGITYIRFDYIKSGQPQYNTFPGNPGRGILQTV